MMGRDKIDFQTCSFPFLLHFVDFFYSDFNFETLKN